MAHGLHNFILMQSPMLFNMIRSYVEDRSRDLDRVNNNLKGAHLRCGDVAGALRAVERILVVDDGLSEEQRDRGLMLHHLGRTDEARVQLRAYLERWPSAPDRSRIEELLKDMD